MVKQEVEEKRNSLFEEKSVAQEVFSKIVEKRSGKIALELYRKAKALKKESERLESQYEELGFGTPSYREEEGKEIVVCLTTEQRNETDKKIEEKERKLRKTETKLLAKVWGIQGDFAEIMAQVEKELSNL